MVAKRWVHKPVPANEAVEVLVNEVNVSEPLAIILAQRGVRDFEHAKTFFNPSLSELHDPFLMNGMEQAVTRISEALGNDEKILVYGDYDVDGTTSVALFYNFLNSFYTSCAFYIPDRYKEGYGISSQGIEWAKANDFSLIIALDCGIKSVELVSQAKEQGIDFIICDHHRPGDQLPDAVAVLDPKRNDCVYPYKELPGCGIGFKLLQAFCSRHPELNINPLDYLDLVVVSIASDIVPITGENRILAYHGLRKLESQPRPGLKALMNLAGLKKEINIMGVVFGLAPRINAAGRIAHASSAVDLLLAESEEEAYHFADKLNFKNNKRKDVDSEITKQALSLIKENESLRASKSTVLFKKDWHKGVIGIVASRCIEQYHRPTIIFTESNNKATGSARSVPGFDVYEAISQCSDLLTQYGGHMYAAGLTLEIDKIEAFRERFEEVVAASITDEMLIPHIEIDAELRFDNIKPNFMKVLKRMSPYGPENICPVFVSDRVYIDSGLNLIKDRHVKFVAAQEGCEKKIQAIGFNMDRYLSDLKGKDFFKLAYSIEENEFRGVRSLQLNIKDIRFD